MTGESRTVVLGLVGELSKQLHPNAGWMPAPSAASSLDRDLGFDSLARIELLTRLRKVFGEHIVAADVVLADSVDDIVRAVSADEDRAEEPGSAALRAVAAARFEPAQRARLRSIPETLTRLVERDPRSPCVRLLGRNGAVEEIETGELLRGAREIAAGLGRRITAHEPVALMLPTGREFLEALFGIQMAGGIPVPLAPVPRPSQIEDHLRRQVWILDDCRAGVMIAAREVAAFARISSLRTRTVRQVTTLAELRHAAGVVVPWRARGGDPALLQYTSGSTGAPKGVVLTHANLLANLEAIARALRTGPEDVFVSWLPLYHDMGLIGGLLHPLYCGIPLVLLSPLAFLTRPELWVEAIHRFRGTMTVAPNFAYEICQRRAAESDLSALDLTHWRLALNGAEPVSPATIDRFCARFGPLGFRRQAMLPVYGLAENSLAVSFPALGRGPTIDRVHRDSLLARGLARKAGQGEEALSFVSCGQPIHQVELRLVDEGGREVPEREVGRIQFRGPSATSGYYRNDTATRELFDGDWIESGDLGYLAEGELYLTGRSKDIVIHAGRNLSPHALEEAAGEVEGIRKGCVAVFGVADPDLGTERLIVVAESREEDPRLRRELIAAVNEAAVRVVGVTPDDVCLVPPHTLLKTSSGKIRRAACRGLYASGELARGSRRAVWRQMLATVAGTARVATERAWRSLPVALYSAYLWLLAAVILTLVWSGVLLLPRSSWRHRLARVACRTFFFLAGVPIEVSGLEHLQEARRRGTGFLMVSNHASYLDPMILLAALPQPLSFVAKQAFDQHAVTRLLMRRLGATFVDAAAGDPRAELDELAETVKRGEVVMVFAEGTFVRVAGLRPFKLGAFEVAVRAGRPVVPVVLTGSRILLRDEQWWFRRSALEVRLGPALDPSGAGFMAAVRLRDEVRGEILRHLDEPDLVWRGEASIASRNGRRGAIDGAGDRSDDGAVAEGAR